MGLWDNAAVVELSCGRAGLTMRRGAVRRPTIRAQLAALVLVVALPLLGLVAYAIVKSRSNDSAAAERTSIQLAALTASSVQEFIASAQAQMAIVARRPLVRLVDRAHCDPFLDEVHRLNGYFADVGDGEPRGTIVCSAVTKSVRASTSVADTAWFKRARRTDAFIVSEPFVGPVTHKRVAVLVRSDRRPRSP